MKEKKKSVKIVAVEPSDSPVLSKGTAGPHKIQGIGAGFVPTVLNTQIYDEIMPITAEKSFETAKLFAHKEGILVGISSGAACMQLLNRQNVRKIKEKRLWHCFRTAETAIILHHYLKADGKAMV